jgi:hypothetical protein
MDDGNVQLVIVDGNNGYVMTLATNVFAVITAAGWMGSRSVVFMNNYFVFCKPDGGQYYSSNIDDAQDIDALDFATAEYKSDDLSVIVADNEDLRLLGTATTQIAYAAADGNNFPFSIRNGASRDIGCIATFSAGNADSGTYWIGGDRNGGGIVYMSRGYQ